MDSPIEEIQYTKATPTSNQDGTKKKKSTRKKPEPKPAKTDIEVPEIPTDPTQDANADLIQHAYKLEHELAVTKKKLKNQRKKFRQLIYSLAKYIDAKGITAHTVNEYVRGIRCQVAPEEDSESEYDKFYSTYKYIVVDEHSQQNGQLINTNGRKSATKTSTNMLKGSTTDHITIDADAEAPQQEQQKVNKGGRPKKDPASKEPKTNGEEPKKRKTKKQKEGEDRKASVEAIDLEEIPNPSSVAKAKKDDKPLIEAPHIPSLAEGLMRQQNIPSLDPTEIMKAYMMNPAMAQGLGMNIPSLGMFPGLQGMPQMSENDVAMFSKVMEEVAKGGLGNLLGGTDMMNFYPGNFK